MFNEDPIAEGKAITVPTTVTGLVAEQQRHLIEQQFEAALRACLTDDLRRQRVIHEYRADYVLVRIVTTFKIPVAEG